MRLFKNFGEGLAALLLPRACCVCDNVLTDNESIICRLCLDALPATGFENYRQNPMFERMEGRVRLTSAFAGYFFRKDETMRHLIHLFKYKGVFLLARELGRELGRRAYDSGFSADYDIVIPVPLHPSKKRKRGYNQAEMLAQGFAQVTGTEVRTDVLLRTSAAETQTHKGAIERYLNAKECFALGPGADSVKGKRLLLIDDVFTTGATSEACLEPLESIEGVSLGLVTVGYVVD